jgi:hypothetical protein
VEDNDQVVANSTKKQRGKPFQKGRSGNPSGRPEGSRNKATIVAQKLLDGQAEALVQKAINQALTGDTICLRICLERLVPPRKDAPLCVTLPKVETPMDLPKATAAILEAVAKGDLTPSEGQTLAGILENHRKSLELADIEQRLSQLEEQLSERKG